MKASRDKSSIAATAGLLNSQEGLSKIVSLGYTVSYIEHHIEQFCQAFKNQGLG